MKPISEMYNLSISYGLFSIACKVAKLKLIFKKGKKCNPSTYRPTLLQSLILKIVENKVVQDQANEFLSENKIFYNYQSGFRNNHATNLCLLFLTDKIWKGFNEGLLTGMILIDLQKTFGTENHEILLKKLEVIGFSHQCTRCFRSYLHEWIFFVGTDNEFSDFDYGKVSWGLSQGSILESLFFLIYVNDMPQAVNSNLFLYAAGLCLM